LTTPGLYALAQVEVVALKMMDLEALGDGGVEGAVEEVAVSDEQIAGGNGESC
jgi:hypothetical protein